MDVQCGRRGHRHSEVHSRLHGPSVLYIGSSSGARDEYEGESARNHPDSGFSASIPTASSGAYILHGR